MEHRNQDELEEAHWELSILEDKNIKARYEALELRVRYKHELAKATVSWPASKAEAVVISENPVEREEYYRSYYTAPIIEEEMKSKKRKYYHIRWSSDTNTMLDVEASSLWKAYN